MKNQKKIAGIIVITAVIMVQLMFGLGLTGCATTVPIKSVRPPTINTTDIQRMAIRSFENKSGVEGPVGAQLVLYLSDRTRQQITNSGHFTIVAATDPNAEGVFTGEIRRIASNDTQEQKTKIDRDGNEFIETTYTRNVSLEFQYSVISPRTEEPIGVVTRQGSQSDQNTDMARLASVETLAKRIIDNQLRQFEQDIVPTIVSSNVKLMEETSKDKVVKNRMKMAMSLVKNNSYEEAIREFEEINKEFNSAAARSNADILRRAIASDAAARSKMDEILSDTSGLIGKVVTGVVNSLNSSLPPGSNIILIKTDSRESSMLDNAMDQISKTIVQEGKIKIVDRSNQALMNAELNYQTSGYVDDASLVSIGRQLGAQYIVLCKISGEMSVRRLNVTVLNIETSQIVDQKDFEI